MFGKKLFTLLSLSLFVIACEPEQKEISEAINAVPVNAAVIVETQDLQKTLSNIYKTNFWRAIDSIEGISEFQSQINFLNSSLFTDSSSSPLANQQAFFSIHMSGAERFDFLISSPVDADKLSAIESKAKNNFTLSNRNYESTVIVEAKNAANNINFSYTYYKGLLLLSPNTGLVQDAIRQLNADIPITTDEGFAKLYKTANRKDDANIYVNYERFADVLKKVAPSAQWSWLPNTADWTELDAQFSNESLLFTGLTYANDSLPRIVNSFIKNAPQKLNFQQIAPNNTAVVIAMGAENFPQYYRGLSAYRKLLGNDKSENHNTAFTEKYDTSTDEALSSWIDNEFGVLLTETADKELNANSFAFFKTRDPQLTLEKIDAILQKDATETYRDISIYKTTLTHELSSYFGRLYKDVSSPYFIIINDYVIYNSDQASIKGLINDYLGEKTLSTNELFNKFIEETPSRSNILVFAKNPEALSIANTFLNSDGKKILKNSPESLSKYKMWALQMSIDKELSYTNLYVQYNTEVKAETKQVWAAQLDTTLNTAPQLVTNHYTKKKEVIVQDDANTIYLIAPDGNILWKKKIDGAIIGKIKQADLYKNNKLQYVFNTAKKLYVLDRNGNDVENFPVDFKNDATSPVAVFDYDNTRNYRFVIACGKKLLNYSKEGKEVKGWEFKKAKATIDKPARHFVVGSKDFILTTDSEGHIYILNRRGEERIEVDYKLSSTKNDIYLVKGTTIGNSRFVTTNKHGEMLSIFLDGKVDSTTIDDVANNPLFIYHNNRNVLLSDNKLSVLGETDVIRMKFDSKTDILKAFLLNNENYYGIGSTSEGKVYLVNNSGDILEGFPVFGNTAFDLGDIDNNGTPELVTAGKEGIIYCYTTE